MRGYDRHRYVSQIPITAPRKKVESRLEVPAGVWKQGMYYVELPELRLDPEAAMPCIWSQNKADAEAQAKKAIKAFSRQFNVSLQGVDLASQKRAAKMTRKYPEDPCKDPRLAIGTQINSWTIKGLPKPSNETRKTFAVLCECKCGHQQDIEIGRIRRKDKELTACASCARRKPRKKG